MEVTDDIYAVAIEQTTRRIVHELEPILGAIRFHAEKEIPAFADSKTKHQLDRLASFLAAIDTLSRAASASKIDEFDLAELIKRVSDADTTDNSPTISTAGPTPLLVSGDSHLLELALANGVRNALEASTETKEPIVLNWGVTDRDVWVVILDRGIGLPSGSNRVFEIGATTKPNHLGMGLALAKQAMLSVNGQITLTPRKDGGTSFEVRWPLALLKHDENTAGRR